MRTGKNIQVKIYRVMSAAVALALVASALMLSGGPTRAAAETRSYIVQGATADGIAQLVQQYGGVVTSRLEVIDGVAATLSPASAAALKREAGVRAVSLNAAVRMTGAGGPAVNPAPEPSSAPAGNPANPQGGKFQRQIPATDYPDAIGADVVWQKEVSGEGVTVAVVDTGMTLLPGLLTGSDGKIKDRIVGWKDFVENKPFPIDPNGHGTHVAGVIANAQKGIDKEWNGVAPEVRLVGVRVLNYEGFGTYEQVIQGIQWVIEHKKQLKIRVMNLSLVSPAESPYWADPLNQAVTKAWAAGITVVVASGNGGPKPLTVGVPGNNPYVITVGAFTDNYSPDNWNDDYIAPFSASGPTLDGFVKPDVMAPGAHMTSLMLPVSYAVKHGQATQVALYYYAMAGTSQAAGVVAGLAALILDKHENLTPDEVKFRIQVTAFPWVDPQTTKAGYSIWQQGYGRVNAPDAVFARIDGKANGGMDIQADLAGKTHYEGYSYYDQDAGMFRLRGDWGAWDGGYGSWSGGYGSWSGGYGSWSGGYGSWSGSFGAWSGGYGSWSGGYGSWSGGYGSWSGGYGSWSGGYGSWSGGYGSWSGGYGSWSGSVSWIDPALVQPAFVTSFMAGVAPNPAAKTTGLLWAEEPPRK
jgi:serine protease AprX